MTYRIKDWDPVFECYRTRERTGPLSWIQIPTKQDALGFRILMSSPEGVKAYGIFIALVQVAAKTPERGTLADEHGAMSCKSLAFRIGCGEAVMREAMEVLTSQEIGWVIDDAPAAHPPTTRLPPVDHPRTTEVPFLSVPSLPPEAGAKKPDPPKREAGYSTPFETFWQAFPRRRRVDKGECWKIWRSKGLDDKLSSVMSGLEAWKRSKDWTKDGGDFTPEPAKWLRRDRWLNPPEGEGVVAKAPVAKASDSEQAQFKAWWRSLGSDEREAWARARNLTPGIVDGEINQMRVRVEWHQSIDSERRAKNGANT